MKVLINQMFSSQKLVPVEAQMHHIVPNSSSQDLGKEKKEEPLKSSSSEAGDGPETVKSQTVKEVDLMDVNTSVCDF